MKLLLTILTVSVLFSFAASVTAEEELPWVEVEIIIFDQHTPESQASEEWQKEPPLPDIENSVELDSADSSTDTNRTDDTDKLTRSGNVEVPDSSLDQTTVAPLPYQSLAPDELQLTNIANKLKRSKGYTILHHVGWRQPSYEKSTAQAVQIYSNENLLTQTSALGVDEAHIIDNDINQGEFQASTADSPQNEIFGLVKMSKARYLHLAADLIFSTHEAMTIEIPDTELTYETVGLQQIQEILYIPRLYDMHETRRVRINEIHYFDHPMFGMLASVRRFKLPEPEIIEQADVPGATLKTEKSVQDNAKENKSN